jgi:hypothetical protein
VETRGFEPRQLALEPTKQRHLVVGNQRNLKRWWMGLVIDVNPNVTVFSFDAATGALRHEETYEVTSIGEVAWVGTANLKAFAARPDPVARPDTGARPEADAGAAEPADAASTDARPPTDARGQDGTRASDARADRRS